MMRTALRKRLLRRAVLIFCTVFAVGSCISWIVAGQLIAARLCHVGKPPADLPAVSISLESKSGSTLAGWRITATNSKRVLILLHGLGDSRLSMIERARFLHEAGYSIVMIDLQAHGESTGKQTTLGYHERHDVHAAVEYVQGEFPGQPVGVIGVSLGGASAVLASPLEIDVLILESVYTDIRDAVHNRVNVRLGPLSSIPAEILLFQLKPRLRISPDQLRPIDKIAEVGCPVYLMCGTKDRHTTTEETEMMYSTANSPKELWLVNGATHEDLYQAASEDYQSKVLKFLEQHLKKTD